ncbi:MAG: hypothetical protein IKW03_08845 [Clostridia bacterium]|nr:hypothetical protein [Clostridia bacterium]
MLDSQAVFVRLSQLIECFEDEQTLYMPYCETAAAVISENIRTDADASDIRLVTVAATMAYNRYLVAKNAYDCDCGSVRAGDITITSDGEKTAKAAQQMMETALVDAAPLLKDNSFLFRTV